MSQPKLILEPHEEGYLTEMRALSTDDAGERILVGLTVEESVWYMASAREWIPNRLAGRRRSVTDRRRYLDLHAKHERARLEVLGTEIALRTYEPPIH